jgi:hypothetical protein
MRLKVLHRVIQRRHRVAQRNSSILCGISVVLRVIKKVPSKPLLNKLADTLIRQIISMSFKDVLEGVTQSYTKKAQRYTEKFYNGL